MIAAHLSEEIIQTSDITRFIIGGQTEVDGIRSPKLFLRITTQNSYKT
jgi:hypothetical protein